MSLDTIINCFVGNLNVHFYQVLTFGKGYKDGIKSSGLTHFRLVTGCSLIESSTLQPFRFVLVVDNSSQPHFLIVVTIFF